MRMEREHIPEEVGPCPATKRNGEVCGSARVSVSGYCFAHDPEAAAWRAKGGRSSSKRMRAMKRLREAGMGHLLDTLEESLDGLRSGEEDKGDARAKARVAEAILRVADWSEDDAEKGLRARWPTPY